MNFDKESKSRIIFFLGGGGGGGGGEEEKNMNTRAAIFYTQGTLSRPLLQIMKIFLMVFKTEGIVALTIKGR